MQPRNVGYMHVVNKLAVAVVFVVRQVNTGCEAKESV